MPHAHVAYTFVILIAISAFTREVPLANVEGLITTTNLLQCLSACHLSASVCTIHRLLVSHLVDSRTDRINALATEKMDYSFRLVGARKKEECCLRLLTPMEDPTLPCLIRNFPSLFSDISLSTSQQIQASRSFRICDAYTNFSIVDIHFTLGLLSTLRARQRTVMPNGALLRRRQTAETVLCRPSPEETQEELRMPDDMLVSGVWGREDRVFGRR